MVRTLEQAIAEISRLPDADQEQIGRKLLSHVEKLTAQQCRRWEMTADGTYEHFSGRGTFDIQDKWIAELT